MNTVNKIAMATSLAFVAASFSTQAQADEKDGSVHRFVCVRSGNDNGALHSSFQKLTANEISKGYGYGGGNFALKLANNGFTAPNPNQSFAGGSVDFFINKKNTLVQIFYKPVNVDVRNVRLDICYLTRTGQDRSFGPFSAFSTKDLGDGWFELDQDFSNLGQQFDNLEIERVSYKLIADGDDGHVLIGKNVDQQSQGCVVPVHLNHGCSAVRIC